MVDEGFVDLCVYSSEIIHEHSDGGVCEDNASFNVDSVFDFILKPRSGNIVKYNARHLLLYGWLFPHRGSVVDCHNFVLFGVIIIVSSVVALVSCDNISSKIRFPLSKSPSISNNLTLLILLALILSFFLKNILQRWWLTRCHISNVINRSKTSLVNIMAVACNSVLTANATEKFARKVVFLLFP